MLLKSLWNVFFRKFLLPLVCICGPRWAKCVLWMQIFLSFSHTRWQCFQRVIVICERRLIPPLLQLIVGLNIHRNRYPRTIWSCPRSVTKKSISYDSLPNLTLSQHLQVICPALLLVLPILRMFLGFLSSSMDSHSLTTVLRLRKFSVAPLSMRAPSVFNVIDRTSFIFKAFHLMIDIRHVDSTHAATVNRGDSKNPDCQAWPAEGCLFLHHSGPVPS